MGRDLKNSNNNNNKNMLDAILHVHERFYD